MKIIKKEREERDAGLTRRRFLKTGTLVAASGLVLPGVSSPACAGLLDFGKKEISREVAFRNLHTGESFSGIYRVGQRYLPDSFDQINYVLRDFRAEEVFPIDPKIMDMMYTISRMMEVSRPYEIISGYRSPRTNAMLRKTSTGVAKKSLHMSGQAIDIRMAGVDTRNLRDAAISLRLGGVGYYSGSDFVHMDTGKVRAW